MKINWVRIVLGALLLEVVLFAVLVPLSLVNLTLFLVTVPIGCFVLAALVTSWLLRKTPTDLILHGTLVGIVATVMYFGLVFGSPDGLAGTVALYGTLLFWFSQAMRIAGCVAGAAHQHRRRHGVLPSPSRTPVAGGKEHV
jgi:hypothetical protein